MMGGQLFLAMNAAIATKNAAWTRPSLTHFIRVGARLPALISAVCGDEQTAATISYTRPAATMKARALSWSIPTSVAMAAFRGGRALGDQHRDQRPARERGEQPEADPESGLGVRWDFRHNVLTS